MKKKVVSYWKVFKKAVANFVQGDSITYASSIAFYTIFSLPAVLIISVVIGATLYEQADVQREMIHQISRLVGQQSAAEIERILNNAAFDSSGAVAKIIGIGTLIFSATTVFISLQNGLNRIWKIKPKPERGFIKFLINRLISMAMVISFGFILLVSLVMDTVLVVFQNKLSQWLPDFTVHLLSGINIVLSLLFITIIFALVFKVLPDGVINWRNVWTGSILTMILFTIGKYLIGFYIGNSSVSSAYGAAGSLVVILIWVYYSSVILLFGAEFTYVYSEEIGGKIKPYSNAVRVKIIEVEKKSPDKDEVKMENHPGHH